MPRLCQPASLPGGEAGGGAHPALGQGAGPSPCQQQSPLELVVGAEQERLFVVAAAAEAVGAGEAMGGPTPGRPGLQGGLLRVLLVGRREVVDGVLHDVVGVHGLLEAAGDALHGGTAACGEEVGGGVRGAGSGVQGSWASASGPRCVSSN